MATWDQRWANESRGEEVLVETDINPRYPNGIVVGLLMVTGLLGNSLVLYIYHFKMEHTVFTTFVTFLAGLDLTTTLTGMPLDVAIKSVMVEKTEAMEMMCKVAHFEAYTTSLSSGSVLLLIAATRYSKVCKPMGPTWTLRQARLWCLVILLLSATLCTVSLVINGMERARISLGVRHHQPQGGGNLTHHHRVSLQRQPHQPHPSPLEEEEEGDAAHSVVSLRSKETTMPSDEEKDKRFHPGNSNPNPSPLQTKTTTPGHTEKGSLDSKAGGGSGTAGDDDDDDIQAVFAHPHHEDDEVQPQNVPGYKTGTNVSGYTSGTDDVSRRHLGTQTEEEEVVQVYVCRTSEHQKGTTLYYALYGLLVTAYLAICLSLLALHCRISCTLMDFKRRQFRSASLGSSDQDPSHSLDHITQRMFGIFAAITVIFVVSYLPHLACVVVQRCLYPGGGGAAMPRGWRVLLDLAYNSPYLNVVANPFIYGYMSKRFRAHCLHLLCYSCRCCRCCRRRCCCCGGGEDYD